MNNNNGKVPRCKMADCYSPIDYLVDGMCERHYRLTVVEPLVKQRDKLVIEAERIAANITRCNDAIKLAKAEYGVVTPLPNTYCRNGCGFKSPYWNTVETHEIYCTKRRKDEAKSATAQRRKERAPKQPHSVGLTEDDLT